MKKIAIFMCLSTPWLAQSQQEIPLYPDGVPNSKQSAVTEQAIAGDDGILRVSNVTDPTLTIFLPPDGVPHTGKGVVICPGGGYGILAMSHEGYDVAEAFAKEGVAAFVLKYRLPSDRIMEDKSIGPLQDAQRAMQLVRERAGEWGIKNGQVGIAGFSAGGHLASTLSTHYQDPLLPNPNGTSLRPDFSLLVYPVISMTDELTHRGSRNNLLGDNPDAGKTTLFSNELQVTADTPPAFLVHAEDDTAVPIANSESYAAALHSHGVAVKLLTYPHGGHGFGLHNKTTTDQWFGHFVEWLRTL